MNIHAAFSEGVRRAIASSVLACALSGCASGIVYVRLPGAPTADNPNLAEAVTIQVRDIRADLSGSLVGRVNRPGGKLDISLHDNEILGDRIARELVVIYRERGYRTFEARRVSVADLSIVAEVSTFHVQSSVVTGGL